MASGGVLHSTGHTFKNYVLGLVIVAVVFGGSAAAAINHVVLQGFAVVIKSFVTEAPQFGKAVQTNEAPKKDGGR